MAATSKHAKKKTSKKAAAGKKTAKKSASSKTAGKKAGKAVAGASRTAAAASSKKKAVKKAAAGKKTGVAAAGKKKTSAGGQRKAAAARPRKSDSSVQTAHSVIPGIAPYKPGKNEEYMNEIQRDHFRELLLAWRSQLVSDITRTISSMQDESFNHPDPTDRATQETDMSLELRSRDRERKLIKKIDDTIQRIDEDDYGFCDNCGVEIGIARLEARPTATLCIDCKTLDEIRERQMV